MRERCRCSSCGRAALNKPTISFPTAEHFASWFGLSPAANISGGKRRSGRTLPNANRAQALRLEAAALRTSQSALGANYQRLCARMDKANAVMAAAHKLARVIYAMLCLAKG